MRMSQREQPNNLSPLRCDAARTWLAGHFAHPRGRFGKLSSLCAVLAVAATIGLAGPVVASPKEVDTRATFHCISLYWNRPDAGVCAVFYRPAGTVKWEQAQPLGYDAESASPMMHQYRGSVVNLTPDTTYEFKLLAGGEERSVTRATWSEQFKIKKTIRVGDGRSLVTTEGGSPEEGYVLYDGSGATLNCADAVPHGVVVDHSFVIVRGLTVLGAQNDGVVISPGLSDVVIEGCDISLWGSARKPQQNPRWGKIEAGIKCGSTTRRVILQRNRVHHPRFAATRWNEEPEDAHPRGPRAVIMGHRSDDEDWESNHVIRYNEFYSDFDHLFEDVIGGGLNYSQTGHPGRDSDIYGNVVSHATDDLIEADGGGQNVRIWSNYLDYGNVMISLQSCSVGPTYLFRNVFGRSLAGGLGEKPPWCGFKFVGKSGPPTATAKRTSPFLGPVYVYHNTRLHADVQSAYSIHPDDHIRSVVSRNNILPTSRHYLRDSYSDAAPTRAGFNPNFVNCSFDADLVTCSSTGDSVAAALGGRLIQAEPDWRKGHGPEAGATGKYQLSEHAVGRDSGVALPNFNRGPAEEGGAPDLGAHEFGSADLQFGVNAEVRLR